MLATDERAPVIAVVAILAREFLISGLREALAGKVALPVQPLAKWKTAAQMVAIALLLLAPAIAPWLTEATGDGLATAGEGLLWLAAVLTWASAIGYVRDAVRGPAGGGREAGGVGAAVRGHGAERTAARPRWSAGCCRGCGRGACASPP